MSDADPPPAPEGFFGRTMSLMKGKKKDDGALSRTGTMSRTGTLARGGKKKEETKDKSKAKGGDVDGSQKTVFISCSTLIKEVKLCVGSDQHPQLDGLYSKLTAHEIPAEQV
jgi:hypothetical protein